MTESPNPPLSSLTSDLRGQSERFLNLATTRGERSDVLTTALVGCGYALLALVDQHKPARHTVDTCPFDLHELADLARIYAQQPPLASVADDLDEWFTEQGIDMRAVGGNPEIDPERAAFEEHGPP